MGIVGVIITAIALFIASVSLVLAYICLVIASPTKRIAARTVPRTRIPADWNRIMQETTLNKKRRTK
jgi:uncharacterized membrane protein